MLKFLPIVLFLTMTICTVSTTSARITLLFVFHVGAVEGQTKQQQPAYLNQGAALNPTQPHDPSYYQFSEPLVEFPDQVWEQYDAAEYPDQALFFPDEQEYSEEHYPDSLNLDGTG